MDNKFPFPQADDINKVMIILNVADVNSLKDKEKLKISLSDISDRQIQYYLSACMYLGLVDENKMLTPMAVHIRGLNRSEQEIALAQSIVSNNIFGYIYFLEKRLGAKLAREDIIDILKHHISFESDEMYKRRSQTIIKWVKWLNDCFNDSF